MFNPPANAIIPCHPCKTSVNTSAVLVQTEHKNQATLANQKFHAGWPRFKLNACVNPSLCKWPPASKPRQNRKITLLFWAKRVPVVRQK